MSQQSEELYKKYRPTRLDTVVGQEAAVKTVKAFGKDNMPHAVLFTGPSGCGKTTLARIAAAQVGCQPTEVLEKNCADDRGIDLARTLRKASHRMPLAGDRKAFILDEVQSLTKEAQSALLKELEDTPPHAYYFLCTTDPHKLLPTIVTRCTEVKVKSLGEDGLRAVIDRVVKRAKLSVDPEAVLEIMSACDGSARKALVLLNQIKDLPEADQLEAVSKSDMRSKAVDLGKALVYQRAGWVEVAAILGGMDDDPEAVRRTVLGFARGALLKGGNLAGRAALVIDRFQSHFFDSGAAGLALAAYEVTTAGKK